MKHSYIKRFFHIGAMTAGGGPLILALIYWILSASGQIGALSVSEVVLGIVTSIFLAFISGGISVIYCIETLPLMWASLLHVTVLYLDYLIIYLVNGWLNCSLLPILIFTGIFMTGYFIIWCFVFLSIQNSVKKMNAKLKKENQVE